MFIPAAVYRREALRVCLAIRIPSSVLQNDRAKAVPFMILEDRSFSNLSGPSGLKILSRKSSVTKEQVQSKVVSKFTTQSRMVKQHNIQIWQATASEEGIPDQRQLRKRARHSKRNSKLETSCSILSFEYRTRYGILMVAFV